MAKLFKVRNKGLRWVAGAVVLAISCILAVAAIAAACVAIGHGLYALNISWLNHNFIEDWNHKTSMKGFGFAGSFTLLVLAVAVYYGWLFYQGAKSFGDKYFNSIGNSTGDKKGKKEKDKTGG